MELHSSGKYRISRDGEKCQLIIKDIYPDDASEITCELINHKGKETANVKLAVQSQYLLSFHNNNVIK